MNNNFQMYIDCYLFIYFSLQAKHEAIESAIQSNIEKTYVEKAQNQQKLSSNNEQIVSL